MDFFTQQVAGLFQIHVAACADGLVEIVRIARRTNQRVKIAVRATQPDADPVALCVGEGGRDIQEFATILRDVLGETLDLVPFVTDELRFICHAISPGAVVTAVLDSDSRVAELIVTDDSYERAMGDRNVNVQLASELTGWTLRVVSQTEASVRMQTVRKVFGEFAESLIASGWRSVADIADAEVSELVEHVGLSREQAEGVVKLARANDDRPKLESGTHVVLSGTYDRYTGRILAAFDPTGPGRRRFAIQRDPDDPYEDPEMLPDKLVWAYADDITVLEPPDDAVAVFEPSDERDVRISADYAAALAQSRGAGSRGPLQATSGFLDLDVLDAVEKALNCRIPDTVIAYFLADQGNTYRHSSLEALARSTNMLLDRTNADESLADAPYIVFDFSFERSLAFERGADSDTLNFLLFEDEYPFRETPLKRSRVTLGQDILPWTPAENAPQFEVFVARRVTADEAEWVHHPKFGRGRVVERTSTSKGDKLSIEFKDGEVRRLLARFVQPGEST